MLEEHSQENNIKSSFFSRSSKYQLDVNSVYRPKYSTLMLDKPLNKPFFSRNYGKSSDKVKSATKSDDLTSSSSTELLSEKYKRNSSPECNIYPSSPMKENKSDEAGPSPKSEVLADDSVALGDYETKSDSKLPSANEKGTSSEESQKCDVPITTPQVSDFYKSNTLSSATFTPTPLMDLPPSIYLPSFHPLNPVLLNPNVAPFAPTPIESLMNPVLAPQMFPQQPSIPPPRKPFQRSKNKHINNLPQPLFQDNGLYGLGFPQNGTNKEYYVMVHVEAGATFSIRTGDQEQQIPGPATVRLVVNNGPPLPMSMQVPPGHLVQQIVDEDGILTHLILTPIHPYPQYSVNMGNSAIPRPPNLVSSNSRLPQRLFASGNSGLNVVISPKTTPGLAITGPTWPGSASLGSPIPLQHALLPSMPPGADFLSATSAMAVSGEVNAPPQPAQPLIETRRKSKTEKQAASAKKDRAEETIQVEFMEDKLAFDSYAAADVTPCQTPDKTQSDSVKVASSASARPKKQPAASSNSKKSSLDKESSKTRCRNPRKGSSKDSTTEDSSNKKTSKCNGEASSGGGDPKDSLDSAIPDILRDDFSSIIVDELDGKSKMESTPQETGQSEDTSSTQRSAKPVNIVRPTNGGRPLPALNGDLTPAEACELKASLGGRLNGRPLNSSTLASLSNSTTINSTTSATIPSDNVWTTRKLASLNNASETSNAVTIPSNNTIIGDQPEKSRDKLTKQTTPNTPTQVSKSSASEKRKKVSNKSGDASKPKGGLESGQNERKSGKLNQHQIQQPLESGITNSSNSTSTTVATILDVTDPTPPTFLPHGAQPAFYAPSPFYAAGGPFFPDPHHVPPHSPHGCFLPLHPSQNQPLPPYLFSGAPPGVSGPPYLSFQPPHLIPTAPMHHHHPVAGQNVTANQGTGSSSSGPQLMGLPPPFVGTNPTTVAALAASAASGIGMSDEERNAIVQVLSKIAPPKISEVGCNNVTINITLPEGITDPLTSTEDNPKPTQPPIKDNNSTELETSKNNSDEEEKSKELSTPEAPQSNAKSWCISPSDLGFALYLAERNENYVCVYVGEVMSILLQDLRPGVHYNTKVCCMYEGLCGAASESAEFTTLTTIPAAPRLPNVFARTKSSLSVRWAVPADNGSKITSYRLQCATVTKGGVREFLAKTH
ncbi:unnamed protein product [Hymenolepis diminuta]|uniref:Fibronectin type-III domain-containing protein n=1 Tax=Hymenolepis diminuta TaxID=6216 RepID=A0A158QCT9_HYMDI|nr:unnamed protein product [Hymenolepis diminuta]